MVGAGPEGLPVNHLADLPESLSHQDALGRRVVEPVELRFLTSRGREKVTCPPSIAGVLNPDAKQAAAHPDYGGVKDRGQRVPLVRPEGTIPRWTRGES